MCTAYWSDRNHGAVGMWIPESELLQGDITGWTNTISYIFPLQV